jgi:hypothetical protein
VFGALAIAADFITHLGYPRGRIPFVRRVADHIGGATAQNLAHAPILHCQELTRKVGIANLTLPGIERRKRRAGIATTAKLAEALNIMNDQVIETWPHGMKPQD